MVCEACVGEVVYNVEVFSCTIFSGAGDRLVKMSSYVQSYKYVEVYGGLLGVLVYRSVVSDRCCSYVICLRTL